MKSLLLALAVLGAGCATSHRPDETPPASEQELALDQARASIMTWVVTKDGAAGTKIRVKLTGDDGDALLFNAHLCASGDKEACAVVKASQDGDGRVWRSSAQVGMEKVDAFSRDMAIGGLLYIAVSGDKDFGNAWAHYVKKTKRFCPKDSDLRCLFNPMTVALWNYVADKVGFEKVPYSIVTGVFAIPMPTIPLPGDGGASTFDHLLEAFEPTTPAGFPVHLLASQLMIKDVLHDWNPVLQRITDKLVTREPLNAFYKYLQVGRDKAVAALVLQLAPAAQSAIGNQWSWERTDAEEAWTQSCGWDFVYVINLLRGPL